MAVAANAINGYPFKSIEFKWENMNRRSKSRKRESRSPPLFLSTNPSHVNPHHLRDLFASSNFSCHRFPNVDPHGRVEPVNIHKLRIALSHSSVVVSVFCKPQDISAAAKSSSESLKMGDLFQRLVPVTHSNGHLVGFGRAVSDNGLTASIYDVMVVPSLRGMGIGRMIVNRIVRTLTSRDIYDIAAICSENERRQILSPSPVFFTKRSLSEMGKFWVEVCLISARGLRRTSSLWKLQWFAVGWIDPNNKYCTKIDASGNANPVWKTKFSTVVDKSEEASFQDLALHVEVYSREPIFLRERLEGTATVILKEFLAKYKNTSEVSKPGTEEVGSFQLRKRNSSKPQGFVDISIHVSEEREEQNSYQGGRGHDNVEGFQLMDHSSGITLATENGTAQAYHPRHPLAPLQRPESHPQPNFPYPMPFPSNYSTNPSAGGPSYPSAGRPPSYQPPRTPPPPPPPPNVGYIPTFLPRTDRLPETSYVNMPSSAGAAPGRSSGPGFAMGVGAGALAAGAVIFGDDFMSGFDFPAGLQDASLTIATDPPF